MKIIRILWQNLGWNALKLLRTKQYIILLTSFFYKLPEIIKIRNLDPLDSFFTEHNKILLVYFRDKKFKIDLEKCDDLSNEGSFTFGLVRELYIKNCYLKYLNPKLDKFDTVIDLGGNRGIFSLLACNFAKNVIMVEPQTKYKKVISHNLGLNNFTNLTFVNKFIGGKSSLSADNIPHTTLNEILNEFKLNQVDFLKIDIEGAEFDLFSDQDLYKIKCIAMELHPNFGSIKKIEEKLNYNGFETILTNMDFTVSNNYQTNELMYLYGNNKQL